MGVRRRRRLGLGGGARPTRALDVRASTSRCPVPVHAASERSSTPCTRAPSMQPTVDDAVLRILRSDRPGHGDAQRTHPLTPTRITPSRDESPPTAWSSSKNDGVLPLRGVSHRWSSVGPRRRLASRGWAAPRPRPPGRRPARGAGARRQEPRHLRRGLRRFRAPPARPHRRGGRGPRRRRRRLMFVALPEYEGVRGRRPHQSRPRRPAGRPDHGGRWVQPRTVVVLFERLRGRRWPAWIDGPPRPRGVAAGQAGGGASRTSCLARSTVGRLAETFPLRLEDTPAYLDFPGEGDRCGTARGCSSAIAGMTHATAVVFPFGTGSRIRPSPTARAGLSTSTRRRRV